MRLITQKAKKGYISLILAAVFALGLTNTAHAQHGRKVPRFDKSLAECHSYRPCVRDYSRRANCNSKQGTSQRRCYVLYAAGYFGQSSGDALRVATCESYPWLDNTLTAPQVGMWQFNPNTWAGLPSMFHKGRGIHSPKYSSLGAMWYWSIGHKYEWVCQ